jgi:enterochelin esterase-like enzyme
MHDGQMLYDSNNTWNHQSWEIDEIADSLQQEKKLRDFIIVGIWNSGAGRHSDYFPQKPFENLTTAEKEQVYNAYRGNGNAVFQQPILMSDDYLRFIVYELKPFIDSSYSTRSGKKFTMIAGSSMGGLISMYAICEYPNIFGAAACLSTHWPGIFSMDNNPVPAAFFNYLKTSLPSPRDHKLYFDYGDATLDALYPPLQQEADKILKSKGFNEKNWITRFFPGDNHSEAAWRKRMHIPLLFLLGKEKLKSIQ